MIVNHTDQTAHSLDFPDGGRRRAALYLRSACAPQAGPCSALDAQRHVLLDSAARHNLELVAEYSDIAASGLESERPGLNRLLHDAKQDCRPFDIVLMESPSHLSRQLNETVEIALQLTVRGIQLYRANLDCFTWVPALESRLEGDA